MPTLKDIGLFGPKVRQAFTEMGVIGFESVDLDGVMAEDERTAEEIDAARRAAAARLAARQADVAATIATGAS
ncbi:hypothetical protein Acit_08700 [Aciditerrimonas ferrireducens]|nr:hypothetical protein [Aciditerrimonas ferrireducens]MCK4177532.1 hypothetical protein [Aciditerrimonas ferrireducens]